MSTFYPFGIPSTSSFAISASRAYAVVKPDYTAPFAFTALNGPPGTPGANATICPSGFINAYAPGPGYSPVPSNPNVNRSQYLLCFGEPSPTPTRTPSPTPTPSITFTPTITPSISKSPAAGASPTPSITPSITFTPTITPSKSTLGTIALTIGGNIVGGFPDYWIVKSNVAVPVDVIFGAGSPEFRGYYGTTMSDLTNCENGDPVELGDTFPGATIEQGNTSAVAAGPGDIGSPITWRNSNVAYINTNDGNGSQLRTTGTNWTDANGQQWSLTITDQTCNTNYPA